MRAWIKSFSLTALVAALAATAEAAATIHGSVDFTLSRLPPLSVSGNGPGSGAAGAGGTITLGVTPFASATLTPGTTPPTAAFPRTRFSILMVAPTNCTFSAAGGGGGGFGGACGLGGTFNLLVGGAPFLVIPASPLGGSARLAFGLYGSYIDPQIWTTGIASITINGAPMTTGNATTPGAVITMAGYDNRSAWGGAGDVKLVAPAGVMSTLGGFMPLFVSMTLTVNLIEEPWTPVPEPGIPLLLGSAIFGLGMLGRKKQK
ncbi:MAG: PEP-CTERM sorting domain-containing protein [bacterium]|nr:PEP-CTERM sorting domain-containing protein [bacterium]